MNGNDHSVVDDGHPVKDEQLAAPALVTSIGTSPGSSSFVDVQGSRSPGSDLESDGSFHSYPSLPGLTHGMPSSPDSYHSGSSSSIGSAAHLAASRPESQTASSRFQH